MPGAYDSQASEKHRRSAGRRASAPFTNGLHTAPSLRPHVGAGRDAAVTAWYPSVMSAIRARVHNGRLQLDQPTELPEGTVLDLVVDDAGDDLDDLDRAALNESISRARASMEAGRTRPMRDLLADLQRRP
jgi:hypothetical protein